MSRLPVLILLIAFGFVAYWLSGKENQTVLSYLFKDYFENTEATGLLLGSSTLAYIEPRYLPSCRSWQNRAVGNSQIKHTDAYIRYAPVLENASDIVLYVGENDIAYGMSPDDAFARFSALINQISAKYSSADIYAILVKPSPARAQDLPAFDIFNERVAKIASQVRSLTVLNLMEPTPTASIFDTDGIHLNVRGYMKLHFELMKVCND